MYFCEKITGNVEEKETNLPQIYHKSLRFALIGLAHLSSRHVIPVEDLRASVEIYDSA
jgi:hypothetical protein